MSKLTRTVGNDGYRVTIERMDEIGLEREDPTLVLRIRNRSGMVIHGSRTLFNAGCYLALMFEEKNKLRCELNAVYVRAEQAESQLVELARLCGCLNPDENGRPCDEEPRCLPCHVLSRLKP